MSRLTTFRACLVSATLSLTAAAAPVINEIMYHSAAVPENAAQEWIEIYNPDAAPVSIAGWKFSKGVKFTMPAGTTIPAGGYLVVAADVAVFNAQHPGFAGPLLGGWTGGLGNGSDQVQLDDAAGAKVCDVTYAKDGDWALRGRAAVTFSHQGWEWFNAADGGGKTIELRNPVLGLGSAQNWGVSTAVGGTPGAVNTVAGANLAPLIKSVKHLPEIPKSTEAIVVSCSLEDEAAGATAALHWRLDGAASFSTLAMVDTDGDGRVEASIPAQANLAIVEWYVSATDGVNTRTWPAPARTSDIGVLPETFGQVTNALVQVDNSFDAAATFRTAANAPIYRMILTLAERNELVQLQTTSGQEHSDARFNATFISHDGTGVKVRYNCDAGNRGQSSALGPPNNYHVGFNSDATWNGRSTIGLNSRYAYGQALGSALYARAGIAPQDTAIAKVRLNGADLAQAGGVMYSRYARIEGRGSSWAAHHYPNDPDGNFYRLDYHYPSVAGVPLGNLVDGEFRYEGLAGASYADTFIKESNLEENDFSDLVALCKVISASRTTDGTAGDGSVQPKILDADYPAALAPLLDLDETYRFFATDALIGNMEGGLQNGGGDDASLYRGVVDPRFKFIPHDMDTIFDIGDTTGGVSRNIFSYDGGTSPGTGVLGLTRIFNHPQLVPRYYAALLDALNTWFNSATLDPMIDQIMAGWVPATDAVAQNRSLADIKAYVTARRTNVLAQIQQNYSLVVTTAATSTEGYKQTNDGVATFSGTFNVAKTYSITVNGVLATTMSYRTTTSPVATAGTWSLAVAAGGGTVLKPGLNEIVVKFWDGINGTGSVLQTLALMVFYNTGTSTQVSGTLTGADVASLTAPDSYVPGVPMLVRVDLKDALGNLDRQAWTKTATLTASGGQTLTPGTVTLYNGMGSALVTVGGGAPGTTQLIAKGGTVQTPNTATNPAPALWKYLDAGGAPAATWKSDPAFDESAWSGPSVPEFSAFDVPVDERTHLNNVSSTAGTRRTWYFRTSLNVADPAAFTSLTLKMLVDDGAVAYINGVEVARTSNMPAGQTHTTAATTSLSTATTPAENAFQTFTINNPASVLIAGQNLIAVEVHNADASVDLSFDLELIGNSAASNPGNFTLTATVPGSSAAGKALTSLNGVAQTSVSGTLAAGTTNWSGIIHVTGDVTVPVGATLAIAPGTHVLLDGTVYTQGTAPDALGKKIIVNGTLNAGGTAAQPISFTCSDAANRWGEINQAATGAVTLQYCLLSRACHSTGGGHTGTGPMLRVAGGTLLVEDSVLSDSPGKIFFNTGNPTVTFRRTHCARTVTGPEVGGSTLTIEDSNFTEMLAIYRQSGAQDDEDSIYVHDSGGRPVNLRRSVFGICDDDALDCLAGTLTVEDCVLRDAFDKGISLLQNNVTVRRSQIIDCDFGISLKTQIGDEATLYTATVESCTIVTATHTTNTSDQTGGVSYHSVPIFTRNKYGTAANAQLAFNVKNSILSGITPVENDYGAVGAFPLTTITYTCYYKQSGTNPIDPTSPAQTGDITADPLFADAAAKNFRLQASSPCINTGNPAETDPDATRIDMGALPYGATAGGVVTWTPAGGPYQVTDNLTIPAGVTLTIQPGTSVQVAQNKRITINGKLLAQGTAAQHITFSHVAGTVAAGDCDPIQNLTQTGPPKWGGVRIIDSLAQENIVSYCDFINAQGTSPVDTLETDQENWGGLGVIRSWAWVDNCTWTGSHLRWCYGRCAKLTVTRCNFGDMFDATVAPPADFISGSDNKQEPLKVEYKSTDTALTGNANFAGGFPVGGWFRVYYNDFRGNKGHNDVFDGDGGRVGTSFPLDCRYNYFHGLTGDEHMDLKGDALIANNIIEHGTKDQYTSDTGYSNAISTDGLGAGTTNMVARNLVFDMDHLINCKLQVAAFVEHNTIANMHADFHYSAGSPYFIEQDVKCSVVNMLVYNDAGGVPPHGDGCYLGYNIVSGIPRLVSDADTVQTSTNTINHSYTTKIEFNQNICDQITDTSIGFNHPGTIYASAFGTNTQAAPLFVNSAAKDYTLKSESPAHGTGPTGIDVGWTCPEWAYIVGGPTSTTNATSASFTVGGPGLIAFKWRFDGGAYSAPVTIGTGAVFDRTNPTVRTGTIALSSLATGAHTLEVLGMDFAGNWQDADPAKTYTGQAQFAATARTWTVDPTFVPVRLNEILADSATLGDTVELQNISGASVSLTGWSLTDDPLVPNKLPLTGTIASGAYATFTNAVLALDTDGDTVYLYQSGILRDSIAFGPQIPDKTIGRNATGAWVLCAPTLGAVNTPIPTGDFSTVKISEWLASGTVLYSSDWIELQNTNTNPVALAGLRLTDNRVGDASAFTFPALSFLAGNGYVRLVADSATTPGHLPFSLDAEYEVLSLLSASGALLDTVSFYPQTIDYSMGRDGAGVLTFYELPTRGFVNGTTDPAYANALALIRGLRLTEIMYNPLGGTEYEFVELRNVGAGSFDLAGVKFVNGIDFTFPTTVLVPGQNVIVVRNLAKFRNRYGNGPLVAGIYTGSLDNSGEKLTLQLPPPFDANVLTFSYSDAWQPTTDGSGRSLIVPNPLLAASFWGDKDTWAASTTNGGDPNGATVPALGLYADWAVNFGALSPGFDGDFDGITALVEFGLGMNPASGTGGDGAAGVPAPTLNAGHVQLHFLAPTSAAATQLHGMPELTYTVLASSDLVTWSTIATKKFETAWSGTATVTIGTPSGGFTPVTVENAATSAPRFLRLQVTWTP